MGSVQTRRSWLLSQPSAAYLRDPYFYFKYDSVWLGVLALVCAATYLSGWSGFALDLSWRSGTSFFLPWLLAAAYVQVMCGVFIHNCTHVNFPRKINRIVGEICGLVVGTRYASWEILHRYHHLHSDDIERDPHPVTRSFWLFFFKTMLGNLESNLHRQYYERWGENKVHRRRETLRSLFSFFTGLALMFTWYRLLGMEGFFLVYAPALVFGALHVSHFNWVTHNANMKGADAKDAGPDGDQLVTDFRPINIDTGVYWLANRILFGLYMHANHHSYTMYFNPLKIDQEKERRAMEKVSKHRVGRGLSA